MVLLILDAFPRSFQLLAISPQNNCVFILRCKKMGFWWVVFEKSLQNGHLFPELYISWLRLCDKPCKGDISVAMMKYGIDRTPSEWYIQQFLPIYALRQFTPQKASFSCFFLVHLKAFYSHFCYYFCYRYITPNGVFIDIAAIYIIP